MSNKKIIVDANVIIRAVLGNKVISILTEHSQHVHFYTPDICFKDAQKYLPQLFIKHNKSDVLALEILGSLKKFIHTVDVQAYEIFESKAKARIQHRDIEDWPIVACSLLLNSPVWTHDTDFFGTGVSTWTTETVNLYLTD
ncbi:MAG: PIN domain-containing protein [Pseudomonadota bacterium]